MSRLTVFVPDLFAELLEQSNPAVDARRWPVLGFLLARARERHRTCPSIESNLCALFGPGPSAGASSVADLTASIDDLAEPSVGIMRADPVHLRADPNQVLLFNDPSIMPSTVEADALIETLNSGLPGLGLRRGRNPARWYFCPQPGGDAITVSPGSVNGRSIANFLPRDQGADGFVQLMNEAQILLHDASINAERETRGIPPINSIWIWGVELAHSELGTAPRFVVGDDVLTAALAQHLDLDWCADLAPTALLSRITSGDGLVVLGSPTGSVERNERTSSTDDFEQRWGPPILNSLRRFRLAELRVVTDRQTFTLTPWGVRKFWRTQYTALEGKH